MVRTSTIGVYTGRPHSISNSAVRLASPPAMRLTSKLVPPMSMEMRFSRPTRRPKYRALSTPPTGPDTSRSTGLAEAALWSTRPPLDFIIRKLASTPMGARPPATSSMYSPTSVFRKASASVVLMRSYSRQRGYTSWLSETRAPGCSSAMISRIRSSLAGFT